MAAANDALRKANFHGKFFPARNLSEKQLKNILSFLPKQEQLETIFGFYDTSLFDNGKDGFVLTKTHLYYKFSRKQPVELATVDHVGLNDKNHHLLITYKSGYREDIYFSIYHLAVKALLEVYIEYNKKYAEYKKSS